MLLAGDTNLIPCRFAFPMSYEWNYGREDNMPCDLYFSDLDGNWNQNGNSVWGEVEDDVDLHPDVHVGRAPCEDIEEAWTFWNKIKTYETTDPGHHDETLLAAGVLWTDPFTDDADVKKYIKNNHIPPGSATRNSTRPRGTTPPHRWWKHWIRLGLCEPERSRMDRNSGATGQR